MLLTDKDCLHLYGQPEKQAFMTVFVVPDDLHVGTIPKKIYCNRDMVKPLTAALSNIVSQNLIDEIKTWDGCFNIRQKRGTNDAMSLHSWGVAIDINAAWNRFGAVPTMPKELVKCFKDVGFDWGGDWSHPDGMHFQLSRRLVGLK